MKHRQVEIPSFKNIRNTNSKTHSIPNTSKITPENPYMLNGWVTFKKVSREMAGIRKSQIKLRRKIKMVSIVTCS